MIKFINIAPTPKPELKQIGKYKVISSLNALTNDGERVFVSTIKDEDKLKTILIDKNNNVVGTNSFRINDKTLHGHRIDAYSNGKHKGLGEIMRLASIIDVIENNLRKIKIFSLNEAIPFHLKYKFRPEILTYDSMMDILNRIASIEEPSIKEFSQKAGEIFADIFINGAINNEHNYYTELPNFIISYVNKTKQENLPWNRTALSAGMNFKEDLPMTLTNKDIKENKSFFNNLFEKHGINYKI